MCFFREYGCCEVGAGGGEGEWVSVRGSEAVFESGVSGREGAGVTG